MELVQLSILGVIADGQTAIIHKSQSISQFQLFLPAWRETRSIYSHALMERRKRPVDGDKFLYGAMEFRFQKKTVSTSHVISIVDVTDEESRKLRRMSFRSRRSRCSSGSWNHLYKPPGRDPLANNKDTKVVIMFSFFR